MKAAVMRAPKAPLVIEDVELDRLGPREVRVRSVASGICHTDVTVVNGGMPMPVPAILGHEPGGVVEEVGREVSGLRPGDHVIGCPVVGCGECLTCLRGRHNLCQVGLALRAPEAGARLEAGDEAVTQFVGLSSFAEELLVHERSLVKVADDLPLERVALVSCGVTTGLGAALNTGGIGAGETAVVIGLGGVGLSALQGCRIAGASQIVAVDTQEWKLDLAKELGATHVVRGGDDAVGEVVEASAGGVDYCFECVGHPDLVTQGLRMVRPGGTVVMVGVSPVGDEFHFPVFEMVVTEKRLVGSYVGGQDYRVQVPRYLDFYRAGLLKLDELVTHTFPLADINQAFEQIHTGGVGKCVIRFDS